MTGWRWFWTLIGFLLFIVVLLFLYFSKPFEELFTLVIHGIGYDNAIFWIVVIVGIVGFCGYHWHAYRVHIVEQHSIESMVLSSLRGSTYIAILLSAGGALQAVQILSVYMLSDAFALDAGFGGRLAAVVLLVILTAIFCVIFWLLKVIRPARRA